MKRLLSVTGPFDAVVLPIVELELELEPPHAARYKAALALAPAVMKLRRVRLRSPWSDCSGRNVLLLH
jgi:hypothetical protein